MRMTELAAAVAGAEVVTGGEVEVGRVVADSRRAGPGDLFVAVRGLRADGHDFAAAAAAAGAAVAVERQVALPPGTPCLRLTDTRWGVGELAAAVLDWPARRLRVIGVTGTAGKSTVAHIAAHVLSAAGVPAGVLSTVALDAGGGPAANRSGQSTMEAPDVQAWLARMVDGGARAAVLEVTSHALDQGRVAGCDFDVAAFTNIGADHLDYHGSVEAYRCAKARLIDLCARGADKGMPKTAVLNRDDASWDELAARPIARRLSYALDRPADVRAIDVEGSRFVLAAGGAPAAVELSVPGRFNVANALCAAAACLALDLTVEAVAAGLSSFPGLSGRLERVDLGQPFRVYVDFAHSAAALEAVLRALRGETAGRLIAVFGATARADHDRPGMGRAGARLADHFVITTDDPLDEDPAELARQVAVGADRENFEVRLDRRDAIRRALELARPGDVVLLAGKGHERTMRLAGYDEPWDEQAEAAAALRALGFTGP